MLGPPGGVRRARVLSPLPQTPTALSLSFRFSSASGTNMVSRFVSPALCFVTFCSSLKHPGKRGGESEDWREDVSPRALVEAAGSESSLAGADTRQDCQPALQESEILSMICYRSLLPGLSNTNRGCGSKRRRWNEQTDCALTSSRFRNRDQHVTTRTFGSILQYD